MTLIEPEVQESSRIESCHEEPDAAQESHKISYHGEPDVPDSHHTVVNNESQHESVDNSYIERRPYHEGDRLVIEAEPQPVEMGEMHATPAE